MPTAEFSVLDSNIYVLSFNNKENTLHSVTPSATGSGGNVTKVAVLRGARFVTSSSAFDQAKQYQIVSKLSTRLQNAGIYVLDVLSGNLVFQRNRTRLLSLNFDPSTGNCLALEATQKEDAYAFALVSLNITDGSVVQLAQIPGGFWGISANPVLDSRSRVLRFLSSRTSNPNDFFLLTFDLNTGRLIENMPYVCSNFGLTCPWNLVITHKN